jgi:hypothetical protein
MHERQAVARRCFLAAAIACILLALLFVRPAPTPGPFMRDFEAYWSAGAVFDVHANPYARAIWQSERTVPGVDPARDELLPFVGPPPSLLLWGALAKLPYDTAARVWWTALALCALGLAVVCLRGAGARATLTALLAAIALAVAFGPVTSDLALGQIALLALFGASFACLPLVRVWGLPARAVGVVMAAMQPNVALGLVSQLGINRRTLGIAVTALVIYAAGAFSHGWNWPVTYALTLLPHQGAERFSAIQITPASIGFALTGSAGTATAVSACSIVAAIAAAVAIARAVADPFARFAAFAPLAPFASGFFHEHDLVVGYVAAVWCATRTRGTTRLLALGGTLLVAIDWLGLAQRPGGTLQSALLAAAALCAFCAFGKTAEMKGSVSVALALAALFAIGAALAIHHPAPVWPDALGNYHANAGASITAVWSEEQRRTGLFAGVPAWGVLRALSLVGCALLSLSVYRCSVAGRDAGTRR